jgi:acetyl-CoA acetyltransferase
MGITAENISEKYSVTREEQDELLHGVRKRLQKQRRSSTYDGRLKENCKSRCEYKNITGGNE